MKFEPIQPPTKSPLVDISNVRCPKPKCGGAMFDVTPKLAEALRVRQVPWQVREEVRMSSHGNARRGEAARTDNGPRWEHGGSDNSAVARARKWWRRYRSRTERRTGQVGSHFQVGGSRKPLPEVTE
jgi:hypothetical protein